MCAMSGLVQYGIYLASEVVQYFFFLLKALRGEDKTAVRKQAIQLV